MRPFICVTAGTLDSDGVLRDFVNSAYLQMIVDNGGIPVVVAVRSLASDDLQRIIDSVQGVLMTGGPDVDPYLYGEEPEVGMGWFDPVRDEREVELVRLAVASSKPVLGICRGLQVVNVAFGGSLRQDLLSDPDCTVNHQQRSPRSVCTHSVTFEAGCMSELCGAPTVRVNSFHHQAIKRIGEGLIVTGRAVDGVVESIEHIGRCKPWHLRRHDYVVAVQWHLEEIWQHPTMRPIIQEFVQTCKGD